MEFPTSSTAAEFNVVTWNILLDNTRTNAGLIQSQADRLPSQIRTLERLQNKLGGQLDAVAIQEAHKFEQQHNGECLSDALGYGLGQWVEHNQKPRPDSKTGRKGEYVGLFGALIDYAEPVELGDNRRAIFSTIGRVAIINIHPRAGIKNEALQEEQARVALKKLEAYQHAILLGDLNNRSGGKARQAIEGEEFTDAFSMLGKRHPATWPTFAYRRAMYGTKLKSASWLAYLAPPVLLDGIYVRGGLEVQSAGKFVGESDHAGLWAKLSLDPQALTRQ